MGIFERARQEVSWPEDAILRRPCLLGLPVQAMDEDDVHFSLGMSVHGGALIPRDLLVDRTLYPFERTAKVSNMFPPIKPYAGVWLKLKSREGQVNAMRAAPQLQKEAKQPAVTSSPQSTSALDTD